ncbi:Bifunctional inhibitor/lipid-transfer protein/seed storage 2S albumin superfamily protein [Tripterygium wilfordii]|uniref:Bifunctional inhibitor/lipid-transfer protein/seed storage 2S albumin superfamily protein n=1 Tax=Tripterygium wilfordii TaxID=458696 RepID=A0A7J7D1M1_TRIWF|nr:non-specific lipid transfer protein GPI-anchored 31-like [Tripterygium wilfordii]KAF5740252.1 Bifunctional inhibitor/lipid-transfer protein/seed storage 2S albumin superfamily protein [Tripterygium wilfordii]
MSKLWVALKIATTWVMLINGNGDNKIAAPPSVDCSAVIYELFDCISFLSDGSTVMKPTTDCCNGYQTVIAVDPRCICFAIKSSGDLGIQLNITKAMTLPSACGFPAPPVDCGTSLPPLDSGPLTSPSPSPSMLPPSNDKPTPSPSNDEPSDGGDDDEESPAKAPAENDDQEGGSSEAPAPSPSIENGGIYSTSVSLVAVISMIVASVSSVHLFG